MYIAPILPTCAPPTCPKSPPLCPLCPLRSYLQIYFVFVLMSCMSKTPHALTFLFFLRCFALPPCSHTLFHPFTPIYTRQHSSAPFFVCHRKNMMFGEISPAIGSNTCPMRSFLSPLALFLRPPVPLYHISPIRTHLHPLTSIYTHLHPRFRCIYVLFIII